MRSTTHPFSLAGAGFNANCVSATDWHEENQRLLFTALIACIILAASMWPTAAQLPPPGKRLIEYGWDVPTPVQMRDGLATMEKRPREAASGRASTAPISMPSA